MPSAWTQNFYHMVFSTKGRAELITPEVEPRLYSYMGGILRDLGCSLLSVNGMPDHVHLLARYRADLSHSDMLRHVKSRSSKWIHETFAELQGFAWQEGYGGFTVSKSMVGKVGAYIAGQKEHHKTQDFRSEFLELLRRHGVEFDEAAVFARLVEVNHFRPPGGARRREKGEWCDFQGLARGASLPPWQRARALRAKKRPRLMMAAED